MKHDFSDAEAWSQRFDDPARDAWQRPGVLVEAMGLAQGMRVADLGAGTGYFLPHLSRAVGAEGRVLGLDPEPGMVAFMERRAAESELANVEARVIPYDDPALEAESIDRILIVNTWHHISDRGEYAARLASALSPGGAIYVVDFTRESPEGPPPEHRLPPGAVMAELHAGGLEASRVEIDLPYQYVIRAQRPAS